MASKREVTLGRREPGSVEITEGIVAGDRVVVEGTLKLRDGAAVQGVRRSRSADAGAATEIAESRRAS